VSSVGSFFSYVNDARSHEPEDYILCLFVASGIQYAKHMRHIVICGLSGSTVFFHII